MDANEESKPITCEGWFYQYEGEWTKIMDEDGDTITTFFKKISHEEVRALRAGYDLGKQAGIGIGEARKSTQIRQTLGL